MNAPIIRPAPIVPASPTSLAAMATRRGALGALTLVPTLSFAASALTSKTHSEWHAAIASWEQVRATWNDIATRFSDAEMVDWNDPTPASTETYKRLDAINSEWMTRDDDALRHIIATPAPDIKAVIYKIRLGSDHGLPTETAVIADLGRLKQEG